MQDGALFIGESRIGEDGPGEGPGSGYPEDGLWTAYQEATRRTTEWYRSRLGDPEAEPDPAAEASAGALKAGAEPRHARSGRRVPLLPQAGAAASIDRAARIEGEGGEATSPHEPGSSAKLEEPLLDR